jgi:hypothetical protein
MYRCVMCPRVMFTLIICQILLAGVLFERIHILCFFLLVQKYLISIACDCCHVMVLLAIPTTVVLSQWTGVLGWGWPRSSKVVQKIIPSWQFKNNACNSALAADATTNHSIEHSVWNAPFHLMGFPSLGNHLRKKCPHALLRDLGSGR